MDEFLFYFPLVIDVRVMLFYVEDRLQNCIFSIVIHPSMESYNALHNGRNTLFVFI